MFAKQNTLMDKYIPFFQICQDVDTYLLLSTIFAVVRLRFLCYNVNYMGKILDRKEISEREIPILKNYFNRRYGNENILYGGSRYSYGLLLPSGARKQPFSG
jgi:hypothetical protein